MVALAAGVEERAGRPVGVQCPAQDADVLGVLAGTEDGEEPSIGTAQPQQAGVAVVAVEAAELAHEGLVGEERGGDGGQLGSVRPEYVVDHGLVAPARATLEAEQELAADGDEVAGGGRLSRPDLLAAEQLESGGAELLGPLRVERLGAVGELGGLGAEPPPQHVVGPGLGAVRG